MPPVTDEWAASDALKASLAGSVGADLRDTWAQRVVKITAEPADWLAKATLYRAERTMRFDDPTTVHHPSTWLMALVPGQPLHMLATAEDWEWLRTADGLRLDTPARRTAYARSALEAIGRSERRYAWFVDSVDELRLFTSSDPTAMPRAATAAAAARARALEAKYRPIILPFALGGDHAPYTGALYANGRDRKIVRIDVSLAASGELTATDVVLESDAPIPVVFP